MITSKRLMLKTCFKKAFAVFLAVIATYTLSACSILDSLSNYSDSNNDYSEGISQTSGTNAPTSAPTATPKPTSKPTSTPTPTPSTPSKLEVVDSNAKAFKVFGNIEFSFYGALKNNNDKPVQMVNLSIDYENNSGSLLITDKFAKCIPKVIKPGEVGYIYSYYVDVTGVVTSNGFIPVPDGSVGWVDNYYEVDVSDVSFKKGYSDNNVEVIGRGTNNTGKDLSFAEIDAVFFDKNDKVIGFCYSFEDFPNGKTVSFSISGDTMAPEIKWKDVDHVKVYIQEVPW